MFWLTELSDLSFRTFYLGLNGGQDLFSGGSQLVSYRKCAGKLACCGLKFLAMSLHPFIAPPEIALATNATVNASSGWYAHSRSLEAHLLSATPTSVPTKSSHLAPGGAS